MRGQSPSEDEDFNENLLPWLQEDKNQKPLPEASRSGGKKKKKEGKAWKGKKIGGKSGAESRQDFSF